MNMRKLVVLTFVSLDGVMQAPGGKGEDPSGGFEYEGWSFPYFDDIMGNEMGKQMGQPFDLLLGRKTYDIFAGYWPGQAADHPINRAVKYVITHRPVVTVWKETIPLQGDAVAEIRRLKEQDGPMLQVHGSSNLIQTLLKYDLVDELWLKIYPLTLGKGKKLFGAGTIPAAFSLMESYATPGGVIIANYKRDGEIKTGSF